MMKLILKLLFVFVSFSALALPEEAQLQYKGQLFSYFSTHSLTQVNADIERVVFTVHGSERNAMTYFNSVSSLAQRLGQGDKTLVIAPHFKISTDPLLPGELIWDEEGWIRGDEAINNQLVSSFELLDFLVGQLGNKTLFPNLKNVVLTGHSAGGQLVQRYAAGSGIDQQMDYIHFRYVVTNPGSYLYLSKRRPFQVNLDCAYNDYKFGLDHLNRYMENVSIPKLINQYTSKDVVYFLGEQDIRSDDIDQSCPAQFQGKTRLERGRAFKAQLAEEFPLAQHQLYSVPGVGHTQYGMYTSELGQKILFQKP